MNDIFEKWVLETSKYDIVKAIKINDVYQEMTQKKIDWIEKGIIGRLIYKYLGI